MCSEKRRLANQRNAQKSTGPRTDEGKARCRRNALKHGLTGNGTVMSRADEARLQAKLEQMRKQLEPIDPLEDILVTRVALAAVRMEKCVKKELALLGRRRHRALRRWEQRQLEAAQDVARHLDDDQPGQAVQALQTTSVGCDLLISAWTELGEQLDDQGHWTVAQADRAARLLGVGPDEPMAQGTTARALWDQARQLGLATADPHDATIDRPALVAGLQAIVAAELERLDDLAEQRWHEHDEPARAEVEDDASLDTSAQGQRLHRYETAAEMSFHRNLKQLISQRKAEPEEQSVKRWHETGKLKPRRWNGLAYEPTNPYYSISTSDPTPTATAPEPVQPAAASDAGAPGASQAVQAAPPAGSENGAIESGGSASQPGTFSEPADAPEGGLAGSAEGSGVGSEGRPAAASPRSRAVPA